LSFGISLDMTSVKIAYRVDREDKAARVTDEKKLRQVIEWLLRFFIPTLIWLHMVCDFKLFLDRFAEVPR